MSISGLHMASLGGLPPNRFPLTNTLSDCITHQPKCWLHLPSNIKLYNNFQNTNTTEASVSMKFYFAGQYRLPAYHARFADQLSNQAVGNCTTKAHYGLRDAMTCRKLCADNPFCSGVNWFDETGLCEEFDSLTWWLSLASNEGSIVSTKIN